jgi:hypothetical protein
MTHRRHRQPTPVAPPGAVAWRLVRRDRSASRWRDLPARAVTPSDGAGARIEFAYSGPQPEPTQ